MYRIKVYYQTGDSFGLEDTEDFLSITWENLQTAKDNLQRINQHYKMYQELHSWKPSKTQEELHKLNKDKDWYSKDYDFCLNLYTDDGTKTKMSAFWCGYFERLYSAEIVGMVEDDLRIEF